MQKKTFNLQKYKLAQVIEGPDMSKFNISKLEMMKEKLEKQYPNIAWTLEEVKKWINKNIFETIYHASIEKSMELSQKDGPYNSFKGSPLSQGIFQFDL